MKKYPDLNDPLRYCIFPFNYPFIDNDGYFKLCCKNTQEPLPFHISEHRLIDVWNSPEVEEIRQKFINGEHVNGCHKCYEPESNGVRSFRSRSLGHIAGKLGKVPYKDNKIRALDLRLGNICNLACIMCFPGNSNRIYQQLPAMAEHYGWSDEELNVQLEKFHARNYAWASDPTAWDNIISGLDRDLKQVYIAGGEPFYLREFPETVKRIKSVSPDAKIDINTNGTRLLREKDLQSLQGIKDINIRFSIDGWGKADEFTRQETVWETKLEVMKQYNKHFNIIVWDITANPFTIRHIPDLIMYFEENYPDIEIGLRPVVNKEELLLSNLPMHLRQDIIEFLEPYVPKLFNRGKIVGIEHTMSELKKPYVHNPSTKKKMQRLVDYWEKNGKVRLEEFDPEVAEWLWSDE